MNKFNIILTLNNFMQAQAEKCKIVLYGVIWVILKIVFYSEIGIKRYRRYIEI